MMQLIKLLFAVVIFVIALSVFLMSPERQTEVLETLGIGLKQRAFFALSILGIIFSTILGIKTIAEKLMVE
jgi:hypothetical protein